MNDLTILEVLEWALKSPERVQRILVQSVIDELEAGEMPVGKIISLMEHCKARGDQEDCDYLERKFRQSAWLLSPSEFCEVKAFFEPDPVGGWEPDFAFGAESRDMESKAMESKAMDKESVHPAWAMYLTLRNRKKGKVITESERRELFGLMDSDLTLRRVRSIEKRYGFYKGN